MVAKEAKGIKEAPNGTLVTPQTRRSAENENIMFWFTGINTLPPACNLGKRFQGIAWRHIATDAVTGVFR